MLVRQNGTVFCVGRSRFAHRTQQAEEETAKIFVRIEPHTLGGVVLAQLDTGAAWSILDAPIAEALDLLTDDGEVVLLSTRRGQLTGRLVRTQVDIVADEGESLNVEATFWVSPEWTFGSFLGYGGVLERIRFALDPADDFFYFGPM